MLKLNGDILEYIYNKELYTVQITDQLKDNKYITLDNLAKLIANPDNYKIIYNSDNIIIIINFTTILPIINIELSESQSLTLSKNINSIDYLITKVNCLELEMNKLKDKIIKLENNGWIIENRKNKYLFGLISSNNNRNNTKIMSNMYSSSGHDNNITLFNIIKRFNEAYTYYCGHLSFLDCSGNCDSKFKFSDYGFIKNNDTLIFKKSYSAGYWTKVDKPNISELNKLLSGTYPEFDEEFLMLWIHIYSVMDVLNCYDVSSKLLILDKIEDMSDKEFIYYEDKLIYKFLDISVPDLNKQYIIYDIVPEY